MEDEDEIRVGDRVLLKSTGEVRVVIWVWEDDGAKDCYVAFFGNSFPDGKPSESPYVLQYFTSSLERFEDNGA